MVAAREAFTRRDLLLVALLVAAGLTLRLALWSGYGLGDDPILRGQLVALLRNGYFIPDNQGYRITWWLPTLVACRLVGLNEIGLIAPITAASVLTIAVVYLIGHQLFGRAGAVAAGLLLAVLPFDVAWSTTLSSDFVCSLASAIAIWCALRATSHPDVASRRRAWAGAAVALVAAYHAKVSGAVLVVPIAAIVWMRRRDLGRELWSAVAWAGVLGALVLGVYWALSGNPFAPLALEIRLQGLTPEQAPLRQVTRETFLVFPRWLFLPSPTGDRVYAAYPHLLVAFLLLGWMLRLRTSVEMVWWLASVFLVMELNVQRIGPYWVAGFRNVRHLHGVAAPLVLALAGYLAALRVRWRWVADATLVVLVGFGLWQAVEVAARTRAVFADRRQLVRYLATLPPGHVYGDVSMHMRWALDMDLVPGWQFTELSGDPAARRGQLGAVTDGYVITGVGQEPYYGCGSCAVRAAELPADRFDQLLELPGPAAGPWWRPEPARLWRARAG